jgi:hypothetical protein
MDRQFIAGELVKVAKDLVARRITVYYESIDGVSKRKTFSDLEKARKYAIQRVGKYPEIGHSYAVSGDGIGKIMVDGVTLKELFDDGVSKAEYQGKRSREVIHHRSRVWDILAKTVPPVLKKSGFIKVDSDKNYRSGNLIIDGYALGDRQKRKKSGFTLSMYHNFYDDLIRWHWSPIEQGRRSSKEGKLISKGDSSKDAKVIFDSMKRMALEIWGEHDEVPEMDIAKGVKLVERKVDRLNKATGNKFKFSFGYVGNLERWGDDREWRLFHDNLYKSNAKRKGRSSENLDELIEWILALPENESDLVEELNMSGWSLN